MAVAAELVDRVGLGFRPDLVGGILRNLDEIDLVEVIADDYYQAPWRKVRTLETLSAQVPVMLHGVSLGLASTVKVDRKRLERVARLLDRLQNFFWSEHLAFVRGGDIELGHLAFPPRTEATVEGAAENLFLARQVVGVAPQMENVATFLEPPGSTLGEAEWLCRVLAETSSDLLLDLHNVHTNSINLGYDPYELLAAIPVDRVSVIHISGGRMVEAVDEVSGERSRRMLDDHKHDVCDEVFAMLEYFAGRCVRPLSVILERDGSYPSMEELLIQIWKAREALRRGRDMRRAAA